MLNAFKSVLKSKALLAFVFGFTLYILIMLPDLIQSGGIIYSSGDYNTISMPFIYHIRDSILEGKELIWDRSSGLGGQFLSQYAYYNLFSPFTLLYLVIPRNILAYAIPYVYAVKFGVGAMLGYFYIRRYVSNPHYAVIGGIVYAFSSFASYIQVFHFIDIYVLFPLLLIALDELCINNRCGVFVLTVALMAILNYYFFFGQAVFCAIYFFIRCTDKGFGAGIRMVGKAAIEALIGCGMAMAVLLPVFITLSGGDRVSSTIQPEAMLFYDDIYQYLKIIQSAFMIPDPFAYSSLFPEYETAYPFGTLQAFLSAYIPLFSAAGVISYIWKNRRSWQSYIMIICAVMALVPVLNQVFSAFNSAYYARWIYMPLLIGTMISVKAIDEQISFKPGIIACGSAVGAMILYHAFADLEEIMRKANPMTSFSAPQNILHFAVTVILLVMLIIIVNSKRDREFIAKLYIFAAIGCYMTYGVTSHYYLAIAGVSDKSAAIARWNLEAELPDGLDTEERVAVNGGVRNYNLIWGLDSTSFYNAIFDPGYTEFLNSCGLISPAGVYESLTIEQDELTDLLSVKYLIASDPTMAERTNLTKLSDFGEYYIYENNDYIPMGFTYDAMISEDAFNSLEAEQKRKVYLKALVVNNTDEFADILSSADSDASAVIDEQEYKALIERHREEACYGLIWNNSGLNAKINLSKENIVFFSISHNNGWTAYVDGEEAEVYNVNNGMIGVRVPKGEHEIELVYTAPGLYEGTVVTCISAAVFAVYIYINIRREKKNVG